MYTTYSYNRICTTSVICFSASRKYDVWFYWFYFDFILFAIYRLLNCPFGLLKSIWKKMKKQKKNDKKCVTIQGEADEYMWEIYRTWLTSYLRDWLIVL